VGEGGELGGDLAELVARLIGAHRWSLAGVWVVTSASVSIYTDRSAGRTALAAAQGENLERRRKLGTGKS
jgi:hypothetical protein